MISRRYRVQEKKLTRKGVFLLFFSVVLLVFLLFAGIPLLAQFAAFTATLKSSSSPVTQEDKTPPAPPSFETTPPEYTQDKTVTIKGRAEAGSTLKIINKDVQIKEFVVDDSAKFSVEIPINAGENVIWATATDASGNESGLSSRYRIVYGKEPPKLSVTKPLDGENLYGDIKTITVEGNVAKDSGTDIRVTVNERLAIVGSDGSFSTQIPLSEGENSLVIVATDEAGNKTEKTVTVFYTP